MLFHSTSRQKILTVIITFVIVAGTLVSCFDDQDDLIQKPSAVDLNNFVYRGLKQFYLYKDYTDVLQDGHFSDKKARQDYLKGFDSPESLFESLLSDQDRFSIIVPDFHKLENELNGISLSNGMAFGLVKISGSDQVFGYVRYVLPNTSASDQGLKRGMLFNRIDGISLNSSNYSDLLDPMTYNIGLAKIQDGDLVPLDQEIPLTKSQYTENPVHIHTIIEQAGHQIGYLLYNGFTPAFDGDLNAAFADFKTAGITDLVVDLRYNPGGSIETSKDLASMITGQFKDKLFATEVYNENFDDQELHFDDKIHTGATINSLSLQKVYVITSSSTASASELLINGLTPYIDVVQIGQSTVGKYQGSTTVYDSPDFRRSSVKPGHSYAMQPLVLKTVNADGFTDYADGLTPDIDQKEDFENLGILGDSDEPLLHRALQIITGSGQQAEQYNPALKSYKEIGENGMQNIGYRRMYTTPNP